MKSLNKVQLIGHVGKEPETKNIGEYTVCNFSLATSSAYKQNGETKEKTEWHKIQAWGKLAEIVDKYIKKGSKIYIEGSLQTRDYEKEGVKHYTTEIKINDLIMLDSKGQDKSDAPASNVGVDEDLPF